MKNEVFNGFLRSVKLPCGELLRDKTTYKLEKKDFPHTKFDNELKYFEKILVLSDGELNVVGGVLFYGCVDIQVSILPKYEGRGYMSAIHKNGILKSELYPNQQVSIEKSEIRVFDDFQKRYYMLGLIGLKPKNLPEVYKILKFYRQIDYSEDVFINKYSN